MPTTHRWILGTAVVLMVTLGFLTNAMLMRTLDELRGVRQQLKNEQIDRKTTSDSGYPEFDPNAPHSSLSTFGQMIPPGQRASYFMDLKNGLAVIGIEEPTNDPATVHDLVLYVADSEKGNLTHIATRDLSGPGHSVVLETHEFQPTVRVRTLTQWEGFDEHYTDYIRIEDGALLLTERYRNGQAIELTRGDKKLEIALSPDGACTDNASEPAKRVNVTGIVANGQEIKFKKSYPVTCSVSEMAGAGFYPEIAESWYDGSKTAQGEELLYMRLPVPVEVVVDVGNLTPSGIKVRDIQY